MKKNDKYGRELNIGDWIVATSGNRLDSGVIVGFSPSGNPRILVYHKYKEETNEYPFGAPKVVGVHSSVMKMETPTDNVPPLA